MAGKTELAWASGLFEGEGCVSVSHIRVGRKDGRTRPYARLALGMTDRDSVERFARAVGCGTVIETTNYRPPGQRRFYRWGLAGFVPCLETLRLLWPGLGQRRRDRAVEVMTKCLPRPQNSKSHPKAWLGRES